MNGARIRSIAVLVVFAAAVLAACGGNPAGPDGQGIVVRGTVQGAGTLRAASVGATRAATVTVSVLENPSISTTVGGDGTFTLRGLPEGGFTLIFTSGTEIGRLSFSEVKANQEITLTVQVSTSGVVLLEEQRNGIGHGDIEIEGNVTQVISLAAAESRFLINGRTVVARPGETAVREGNRSRNIEDVTLDRHVHVKGVWLPMEGSIQPVLAHEIMLQGDDGEDVTTPDAGKTNCAAGQKMEVEGPINAVAGSTITVNQQGKGLFACTVGSSTTIRKGNTTYKVTDLKAGWRVHVSGTGMGLSGDVCNVSASEVKVQQN
jgi:hypothetical protein